VPCIPNEERIRNGGKDEKESRSHARARRSNGDKSIDSAGRRWTWITARLSLGAIRREPEDTLGLFNELSLSGRQREGEKQKGRKFLSLSLSPSLSLSLSLSLRPSLSLCVRALVRAQRGGEHRESLCAVLRVPGYPSGFKARIARRFFGLACRGKKPHKSASVNVPVCMCVCVCVYMS